MARDKATRRVTGAPSHVSTAPLSDYFPPLPQERQEHYAEQLRKSADEERQGLERAMTSDNVIGGVGAAAASQAVLVRPVEYTPDAIIAGI